MANTLVLLEVAHGSIKKASLASLTFAQLVAQKSHGELHAAIIGHNIQEASQHAAKFGIKKVWCVDSNDFEHYLTETYTKALVQIAASADATFIAAASSSMSKDLLPRVATRLQAGMASDVLAIVDVDTFKRPMWAGNVVATVQITTKIKVCSVRATEFDLAKESNTSPAIIENVVVPIDASALKTRFIAFKEIKSERPDITTADRIVSGGRGVKSPEGFKIVETLADALHAGVGASRAVCDAGWVPNDYQIGQTGKIVAPNLYIALGISGAIQHLAGMKGSKVIVAINKDPEAPIFQVADYGLVADIFQAVPEFVKLLNS